jgi:hypothetical protein
MYFERGGADLNRGETVMTRHEQDYLALISAAREPQAIATHALADTAGSILMLSSGLFAFTIRINQTNATISLCMP